MKTYSFALFVFLLAINGFAFSGKRSVPEAGEFVRQSIWNAASERVEALLRNFETIRMDRVYAWIGTAGQMAEKNIRDARIQQQRCQDDWLTTRDAGLQRLNWVIGCLDQRLERIHTNAGGSETNRYSYEELSLVGRVLEILKDEKQKADTNQPFKYPTLGVVDRKSFTIVPNSGLPKPDQSSCKVFEDRPSLTVAGLCNPGCFAPEQLVLGEDGYIPAGDLHRTYTANLVTMDPTSELDNPIFRLNAIDQVVRTKDDPRTVAIYIFTEDGHQLRVSEEHPILLKSGIMKRADKVMPGDELLAVDGETADHKAKIKPVKVIAKSKRQYRSSYTNVDIISQDPKENILVVNGLLVGSNLYQTERGRDLLEKRLFQTMLPSSAVGGK